MLFKNKNSIPFLLFSFRPGRQAFWSSNPQSPDRVFLNYNLNNPVCIGDAFIKAIPHNSARANSEKIWVLMKAVFRRNTLCISRKSDKIRAQIFQKAPKTDCAVLP